MAINKVVYGANTLIDITDTTATTDTVLNGYDFYDASGVKRTGTATGASAINIYQDQDGYVVLDDDPGSAVAITPLSVTSNGTYTAPTGKAYSPVTVNVDVSGGGSISDQVRFYDYDGTLVNSYSASDFNALTAMPSNPSHTGLVAQGWNWSLADAKAYLAKYPDGILNIGQNYTTDTGDTRVYIYIDPDTPENRMTFYIRFTSSVANNVTLDWGDGTIETHGSTNATNYSHTYSATGSFTIKLKVNSGTISLDGSGTAPSSGNSIYATRGNAYTYRYGRVRAVEIGNNVTRIGQSYFFNCYSLEKISVSTSISEIALYAFYGCYSLKSVTIPEGVSVIGTYAFNACYSLMYVALPNSVLTISSNAFQNDNALKSVTIPDGVRIINPSTFGGCYSITSITLPDGITSIGNNAFSNCYSLERITIPSSVTSINASAFTGCYSLTSITVPDGVTSIGENAFTGCKSIKSIMLPDGLTSIGNSVFSGCYSLAALTMPESVASIGTYVFSNCYRIMSLTIPDSVTSISNYAFQSCSSLTSLIIPDGVTSIGTYAFQNCYGISEYHFLPTTPPTLANTNAFTGIQSDCKIYVPQGCLEAYQTATNWSTYASKMVEESA